MANMSFFAGEQDLATLRDTTRDRFTHVQRLMRGMPANAEELMLRAALRRVVQDLGDLLEQIASIEGNEDFASLGRLAKELGDPRGSGRH